MNHQWPPEVTRAMHEFSDAAPVAPSLTSVLDRLPATRSSGSLTARLEPESRLVPMKEMNMSLNTRTTETRNRRRLLIVAAAAVVVVGIAGIALSNYSDDDESPAPAPAATLAPTSTVAPTIGTYLMPESDRLETDADVRLSFAVPDGWSDNDWYVDKVGSDPSFGVVFQKVVNIYDDSCPSVLVAPPIGPSVDDLASAWANLPGFEATAAIDITVDGFHGKQVEFTVPDYNEEDCPHGIFNLWNSVGGGRYRAQGPNQHHQLWILDVNGTRLVIVTTSFPDTSPQDRAALDEILASIQIG